MFGIPFFLKEFLLIIFVNFYLVFCSNEEEKLRKPEREKKGHKRPGELLSHKEFLLILNSQGGQDEYSV